MPSRRWLWALLRLATAGAFAITLSLHDVSDSIAECDGPFPSFRSSAATAERIVIGRVTSGEPDASRSDGRTADFTIEGWSVLEGNTPVKEPVQGVQAQPCAGPIVARVGDVIVIAFGGRDFSPSVVVNAVAWISGVPPGTAGIETVSALEVFALGGAVPPPEIVGGVAGRSIDPAWFAATGAIAILAVGLVLLIRAARSGAVERLS